MVGDTFEDFKWFPDVAVVLPTGKDAQKLFEEYKKN